MNRIVLIGNLVRDPELTTTGNGISVCKFDIAVSRPFTTANGERETDFIKIVVWRGKAESCVKYLTKGSKVCVCGSLQIRTYEDKDGIKRYISEIVADDVEFLTPKGSKGGNKDSNSMSELEPISGDDLPF